MQELATRVGITAAGLYYYFHSKQDLLFEVLVAALEGVVGAIEQAVQDAGSVGLPLAAQQLRAFTHRHATFQIQALDVNAVYGAAFYGSHQVLALLLSEEQRHRLRELQDRGLNLLRRVLQDGMEAGEFEVSEPTVTALAIIGMGEYVPIWFKQSGRLSPDEVGMLCADLALRIVGAGAARTAPLPKS